MAKEVAARSARVEDRLGLEYASLPVRGTAAAGGSSAGGSATSGVEADPADAAAAAGEPTGLR